MNWTNKHMAGLLPQMLSEGNPADAVTQLNDAYAHGGGWHDFKGFTLTKRGLEYPDDPPMKELARTKLRDEDVVLYEYDWVAVIQPDGSYRIARMD